MSAISRQTTDIFARFRTAVPAVTAAALAAGVLSACSTVPVSSGEDVPATAIAEPAPALPEFATADEARARAAQALAAANYVQALQLLVEVVRLDETDADAWYRIGTIHASSGNVELAARAYARALDIDAAHAAALQDLGVLYFEAGQNDDAHPVLERAVAEDPTLWRAQNILGIIADTRGEYSQARSYYTAALALRPRAASILNNRGYSYFLAGNLAAAQADIAAATQADPGHERAWQNLGLVYARQGKYAQAIDALSQVVPRHVASNDVGSVAMQAGAHDAAARLFEDAIRLSPRYYEAAERNLAELLEGRRGTETVAAAGSEPARARLSVQ